MPAARAKEKPLRAVALAKEKPLSLASGAPGLVSLTNFRQFALGVANGFYAKLENDRHSLSERIQAERNLSEARFKREYVCTDLVGVIDPKLSDYLKRRYGKMLSVGRPSRARKEAYYVGKEVGENMVLHRGIEATSTASGRMLPG